jgi:hypothetical protein
MALILSAPLFLEGCGKDIPSKPRAPGPFIYPDQSTIEHTLLRMAAAFARRDSATTESVYADDYEGTSTDLTDPFSSTFTFVKSDERRAVAEMAMSSDITFVEFNLYSQNSWLRTHYGTDPPEWVTLQIPFFTIEVRTSSGGYKVQSPNVVDSHQFEFTFRPTTPAPSPTDTIWSIVRWVERREPN